MLHNTILGFDFGLSKIGIAVWQTITKTARPLSIIAAKRGIPDWAAIQTLIEEWGVDALVVGLPLNMDGTEQPISVKARVFSDQLKQQFRLPVYLVDERLTTVAARDEMHTHLKGQARFAQADSVSAKLIVESWMQTV